MCGRAYDPRFLFAWPNAKLAVMGPQQLAGVLSIVGRAGGRGRRPRVRRGGRRAAARRQIEEQIERESHAFFVTGRLYDDGIIDPRDTRTVLGIALSAAHSNSSRAAAASASSGCEGDRMPVDQEAARSPTAARSPPGSSAPRGPWASPPSRCSPTPTRTRRSSRDADEAVRLPGSAPADTYLRGRRDHRRRAGAPAPTRSTPATASCPRTPASPGPAPRPG